MGNDFTQVINNIDYLVRKDRDTNKHSDFWFSFIVMKENLGEITEFLKIAHASGIRHVRFMELAPSKESIRGVTMPNRDFRFNYFTQYNPAVQREFLEKLPFIRKLAQELDVGIETGSMAMSQKTTCRVQKLANTAARKMSLKTSLFPLKRRKGMCVAPWLGQLVISQGGDVRLCCKSRYSLGNINNSSLEEIWNCEFVKKVRTSFKTETFPRICEYCRGIEFDEYPRNSGIYNSMTPLARPVDNERPKDVL
jgi:radical SAM protein with 4Fe4S-binding SPASM domain